MGGDQRHHEEGPRHGRSFAVRSSLLATRCRSSRALQHGIAQECGGDEAREHAGAHRRVYLAVFAGIGFTMSLFIGRLAFLMRPMRRQLAVCGISTMPSFTAIEGLEKSRSRAEVSRRLSDGSIYSGRCKQPTGAWRARPATGRRTACSG